MIDVIVNIIGLAIGELTRPAVLLVAIPVIALAVVLLVWLT